MTGIHITPQWQDVSGGFPWVNISAADHGLHTGGDARGIEARQRIAATMPVIGDAGTAIYLKSIPQAIAVTGGRLWLKSATTQFDAIVALSSTPPPPEPEEEGPTGPTQPRGDDDINLATTAWVQRELRGLYSDAVSFDRLGDVTTSYGTIELAGYDSSSVPVRMPFIRVGSAEPPEALKFQDDGGDWWRLSRGYTTLRDHGYARGVDIGPALRRALAHITASPHCRTLVLEAPDEDYYTLTTNDPASVSYHSSLLNTSNVAIIGPGRDTCVIKHVGATMYGGMFLENVEGLRLEGFAVDMSGTVGTGHHGLALQNIYGLKTDNLGSYNAQGYGIGVENTDETADRIGRWLLNDTLIENAGSDGMDVKAPTVNNQQIIISTYRVKGWSLYHDTDNALDNRFCGTVRDVDIEFTNNMGHGTAISLRGNQESDFSGAAFSIYSGVQIKGTRGNTAKYQMGVQAFGKRVNMYGVSVKDLNSHESSIALNLTGQDMHVYGLNVDRCSVGISLGGSGPSSNNIVTHPVITRCDNKGVYGKDGSRLSNRIIEPRVEGCTHAYYTEGTGRYTLERPRSYNNGDDYTLSATCRVLGMAEGIKTVPYASARLATTGYVNILSGLENGDTIDGQVLATGDRVIVKDQASAVATHTVRVASVVGTVFSTQMAAGKYMDGVLLVLGDRILVKNQSSLPTNGIYTVTAGAPTRATDADTAGEFTGMIVTATEGIDNAGKKFACTSVVTTLGTSSITFTEAGAINGVYDVQASGPAVRAADSDTWEEMGGQTYYVTAGTANAALFFTALGHNVTIGITPISFKVGPAANSYEPIDEDYTLLCDATAAPLTVQFPSYIQDAPGRTYEVVKADASANAVTINPISSQTINGSSILTLAARYDGARCKSNGAAWYKF